eukprot:g4518.t1
MRRPREALERASPRRRERENRDGRKGNAFVPASTRSDSSEEGPERVGGEQYVETRSIDLISTSPKRVNMFPPRYRPDLDVFALPRTDEEKLALDKRGIDVTDAEAVDMLDGIMKTLPPGRELPALRPLQSIALDTGGSRVFPETVRSKWRYPDGSAKWKEAIVLATDPESGRYLIEWKHRPGIRKEVHRINLKRNGDCDATFFRMAILRRRRERLLKLGLHLPFIVAAQSQRDADGDGETKRLRLRVPDRLLRNMSSRVGRDILSSCGSSKCIQSLNDEVERDYASSMERAHAEVVLMCKGGPPPVARWRYARRWASVVFTRPEDRLGRGARSNVVQTIRRRLAKRSHFLACLAKLGVVSEPFRKSWSDMSRRRCSANRDDDGREPSNALVTVRAFFRSHVEHVQNIVNLLTGPTATEMGNVVFDAYIDACGEERDVQIFTVDGVRTIRTKGENRTAKRPWQRVLLLANMMRWEFMRDVGVSALSHLVARFERVYTTTLPLVATTSSKPTPSSSSDAAIPKSLTRAVAEKVLREHNTGVRMPDGLKPVFRVRVVSDGDKDVIFEPSLEEFCEIATRAVDELLYLIALDPSIYVETFLKKAASATCELSEWRREIDRQHEIARNVASIVPREVDLGLFRVDCSCVQRIFFDHSKGLVKELLSSVETSVRRRCEDMRSTYAPMIATLETPPDTYAKFSKFTELLHEMDSHKKRAALEGAVVWRKCDIFAGLHHSLPDDAFVECVSAVAWPLKLAKVRTSATSMLPTLRDKFLHMLSEESKLFWEDISEDEKELYRILSFGESDSGIEMEHAATAAQLVENFDCAEKDAEMLNRKRHILRLKCLDLWWLHLLREVAGALSKMWQTMVDWRESRHRWLCCDATKLHDVHGTMLSYDGTLMSCVEAFEKYESARKERRSLVYELSRSTLSKVDEMSAEKERKELVNLSVVYNHIADTRREMADFRTFTPLVQAMLTPGLRSAHRRAILDCVSSESAKENAVNNNNNNTNDHDDDRAVTLRLLIHGGAMNAVDSITNICRLAGVEHSIDSALSNMASSWETGKIVRCEQSALPVDKDFSLLLSVVSHDDHDHVVLDGASSSFLFETIGEHVVTCEALKTLPFAGPFADRIESWQKALRHAEETLEMLVHAQMLWRRVTPLFVTHGLARNSLVLKHSEQYHKIDEIWTSLLDTAHDEPRLLRFSRRTDVIRNLRDVIESLSSLFVVVREFVRERRATFSRLHLLNSDEVVQFVGTPKSMMSHAFGARAPTRGFVTKLLPAVGCFEFGEMCDGRSGKIATTRGVIGSSNRPELVALREPVPHDDPFGNPYELSDAWITRVHHEMNQTLMFATREAIAKLPSIDHEKYFATKQETLTSLALSEGPFQATLAALRERFTRGVENVYHKMHALASTPTKKKTREFTKAGASSTARTKRRSNAETSFGRVRFQLKETLDVCLSELRKRRDNSSDDDDAHSPRRKTLEALAIELVYQRDVLDELLRQTINDGENGKYSLAWQVQMRYYFDFESRLDDALAKTSSPLTLSVFNTNVPYGFEYEGCRSRLVLTPLTMRAIRCMVGAVAEFRAGAVVARPGTGKSATLCQLASAMSMGPVLWFALRGHESEKAVDRLSNLLRCAVSSGICICIDHANRASSIFAGVLGTLLAHVHGQLSTKPSTIELNGRKCRPHPFRLSGAIFVSSSLTEAKTIDLSPHLRARCRVVGLAAPPRLRIANVRFLAQGFELFQTLSRRVVKVLEMAPDVAPSTGFACCEGRFLRILDDIVRLAATRRMSASVASSPLHSEESVVAHAVLATILSVVSCDADRRALQKLVLETFESQPFCDDGNEDDLTYLSKIAERHRVDGAVELLRSSEIVPFKVRQVVSAVSNVSSTGVVLLGRPGSGKSIALRLAAAVVAETGSAKTATTRPLLCTIYPETHSV